MRRRLTIVAPVYNDWDCLQPLTLDVARLAEDFDSIHLLIVNDCSTEVPDALPVITSKLNVSKIDLVTNIGHQRAILVGLCYCLDHDSDSDYFVVMDSDGEDNPAYIKELVNKCEQSGQKKVIFARRSKRSESRLFRIFYRIYKIAFRILTGRSISYGNFSCIPRNSLARICNEPNFWNHYSASMWKSKIPFDTIPTNRSKRYFGQSKMKVNNLIIHGLSSLSVYIEEIVVRVLKWSVLLIVFLVLLAVAVLYIKYFTDLAIPGWATSIFGFLFNILITVIAFNLLLILSHLNTRNKHLSKPITFYTELIQK